MTINQQFFTESMVRDLEKEGVSHNTPTSLSILRLQSTFLYNIQTTTAAIDVNFNEIESVPVEYRSERIGDIYDQITRMEFSKPQLVASLSQCSSPTLRLKLFTEITNFCKENLEVINELLNKRQQFSKELGFANFSSYALNYQSFPTDPTGLIEQLIRCHSYIEPKLENEYAILLDRKALQEQESRFNPVSLHPSDIPFYIQTYLDSQLVDKFPNFTRFHSVENYFTIFNVIEGVSNLLGILFGINTDVKMCVGDETWSNDIIKLSLSRKNNLIGYLYLDLFARPGKTTNSAAKFNIHCGKRKSLSSEEVQLPIVVLSCNF